MSSEPENERPIDQSKPFTIQVAERVLRLPPYLFGRINGLLYQKRRSGIDVIDLGMGNPSDPPQDLVIEKLAEAARDPDNHGYTHATGILNLRREIAAKYFKKYGARIDPETEALVSMGSKDAFSHLVLALIGPGDTAIVPAPSYPAHVYAVLLAGGNVMPLEVADPGQYLANIADACQHMVPKPKLVVANFPHNPSAVTIEPDFWIELAKLSRRHGFMIISDSAYADLGFDGYVPPSFLAVPGAKDLGVEMTTMSKGYNMAGWRVGFCCGNSEMIRALATTKAYYDYGMFKPIQIAAIMALRHTDAAVEAQGKIYQGRRDVLVSGLRRLGWDITAPRAGMFVWAKIPPVYLSTTDTMTFAMKLLEEANVAVSPGSGFGPAGEGYLRLAMVENENRLRQAVRQIGRALGQATEAETPEPAAAP